MKALNIKLLFHMAILVAGIAIGGMVHIINPPAYKSRAILNTGDSASAQLSDTNARELGKPLHQMMSTGTFYDIVRARRVIENVISHSSSQLVGEAKLRFRACAEAGLYEIEAESTSANSSHQLIRDFVKFSLHFAPAANPSSMSVSRTYTQMSDNGAQFEQLHLFCSTLLKKSESQFLNNSYRLDDVTTDYRKMFAQETQFRNTIFSPEPKTFRSPFLLVISTGVFFWGSIISIIYLFKAMRKNEPLDAR